MSRELYSAFCVILYLTRIGLDDANPAPFTRTMYWPLERFWRLNECSPALRFPRWSVAMRLPLMLNTSMLANAALAVVKAMFVPFMWSPDFVANATGIQNYFIETAFPSKSEATKVYSLIAENEGIKLYDIMYRLNFSKGRVEKTLKFLENENLIYKEKSKYYASANTFMYNEAHYNEVKDIRYKEQSQMLDFIQTNECYSKYIVNCFIG